MNKKFVVYKICNLNNNKVYIGSAYKYKERKQRHIRDLNKNKHHNQRLQNSWNKHGEENFIFEIIKECEKQNLISEEQRFIDLYNSYSDKNGYNICPKAGSVAGRVSSAETRKKISIATSGKNNPFYGKKHSKEAKKRMSDSRKGECAWNNILSELQVKEIREKYVPRKYSQYKLAKEYGVSRSTIQSIINYKNWR